MKKCLILLGMTMLVIAAFGQTYNAELENKAKVGDTEMQFKLGLYYKVLAYPKIL